MPRQADEGAPPAVLELDPRWAAACDGLQVGTQTHVDALDTLDGTPILDLKPRLGPPASR